MKIILLFQSRITPLSKMPTSELFCKDTTHSLSYKRYGEIVIPLHSIILRDTLISMKQEIRK